MNHKLAFRKAHRYIGLLISIQLLLWTIGGIYFSWTDIDEIHGDHLRTTKIPKSTYQYSTQEVLNHMPNGSHLHSLTTDYLAETPIYKLKYQSPDKQIKSLIIDAHTGKKITEISKQLAIEIASYNSQFETKIDSIKLLTKTDSHHEYREKNLPAWAVTFDHESAPTFYINANTGKLESIRHNSWRIFDFLWMLHTMDYQGRDDFGNWLLKIFSIIALFTSITGIILFIISSRRKRAR